jgi:hypothetical protein
MYKLLLVLPILLLAASCTNNSAAPNANAAAAAGASAADAADAPAASSTSGATYSATIDGQPFSGTTTQGAAQTSLEQNSTIDGVAFQLGYEKNMQGFQFVVKNTGTTELRHDQIITVCNYRAADGTLYIDDSATVTINPGTRTTGTFSGRWKNAHYGKTNPNAPATILVTDGKFDIP